VCNSWDILQAARLFSSRPTQNTIGRALDLVGGVVSVTEGGASAEELAITTDLLRNTTTFLLDFQEGNEGRIMINEVHA
jgi:hypothetical protein